MNTYTKLINKYKNNEKCYVIGAGPSLHKLIYHPLFPDIQNNVIIVVNSAILAMKWEKGEQDNRYFVSDDFIVTRWSYWRSVLSSKCNKVIRSSWEKHKDLIKNFDKFFIFEPRNTPENIIDCNERGLAYASSVLSAIDLALQMGCKKIYLLGVDHYTDGWRSHFWQYWTYSKWPKGPLAPITQQKESFNHNIQAFEALKGFADYLGAEIYNCSKDSKVEVYKKIEFKESLDG